jgi:hypothetical protein
MVAGLTVAIVALPLSMAIAIASGVTPDRGLYTARPASRLTHGVRPPLVRFRANLADAVAAARKEIAGDRGTESPKGHA